MQAVNASDSSNIARHLAGIPKPDIPEPGVSKPGIPKPSIPKAGLEAGLKPGIAL